jgi:flagellar biosynthesis anti-sigma factor FlgM
MKIHPEKPSPAITSPQETKPAPVTAKRANKSAKTLPPTEGVELSPKARALRRAVQVLSATPEVRDAKVQELQQAVERGTYHVPAEQLAEKILRDTLS